METQSTGETFPLTPETPDSKTMGPSVAAGTKPRAPSKTARAGISIPPSRVRAKLRSCGSAEFRFEKDVEIWLAGAVEGVLREALVRLVAKARENRTRRGLAFKRARILDSNLDEIGKDPQFGSLVATLRTVDGSGPAKNSTVAVEERDQSEAGRSTSSSSSTFVPEQKRSGDVRWQYQDNGWRDYDREAGLLVEECYQTYLACPGQFDVRKVKSGQWSYQVDFPQMLQINIEHENHTRRFIRRVVE